MKGEKGEVASELAATPRAFLKVALRQVVLESCAGLSALHGAGLVHRPSESFDRSRTRGKPVVVGGRVFVADTIDTVRALSPE